MATLRKRGNRYYLQFYNKKNLPQRKTVPLGRISEKAALRLKARKEDEYALGEYDPWELSTDISFEDGARGFLQARDHLAPSSVHSYRFILRALGAKLGPSTGLRQIGAKEIKIYLDSTKSNDVTKACYLRHLAAFWSWAVKEKLADHNICKQVHLAKVPSKFPSYIEDADVDRICEFAQAWLRVVIRAAILTGLRRGELVNLKWEDVDLENALVYVRNTDIFSTKSRRDRVIPISSPLAVVLGNAPRTNEYVFTTSSGSEKIHAPYLTRQFRKAADKAGLPNAKFHSLRHTACSVLAREGVPIEAIRQFAGHSTVMVTEKYMHLSPSKYAELICDAFAKKDA